jgi:hypothetical protein
LWLRKKGEKSSRAQLLQALLDEMKPLECQDKPDDEDKCKDKPGTTWDPESGECVCPEGMEWSEKENKCIKMRPPPPKVTRIGLVNLDNDESDLYLSTSRSEKNRERDIEKMASAQAAGVIGNPAKTPGIDDKGDIQRSFGQTKSHPDPETSDYADYLRALKGKSKRNPEPYFSVDGSVISDAVAALKGVKLRGKKKAVLNLTKDLVNRFAKTERKADRARFRKLAKKYITAPLSKKQRANLYNVYADYGLTAPAGIREAKELQRWKVLAGIKKETL